MVRLLKFIFQFLCVILLCGALGVGFLAWRAYEQPLDLSFLKSYIEKTFPGLTFQSMNLVWPHFIESPWVHLSHVRYHQNQVDAISIEFDFLKLLGGSLDLNHIILKRPVVRFPPDQSSSALEVFKHDLPAIDISDGVLFLKDDTKLEDINLRIEFSPHQISGKGEARLKEGTINVTGEILEGKNIKAQGHVKNIDLAFLDASLKESISGDLSVEATMDHGYEGSFSANLDYAQGHPLTGKGNFKWEEGDLTYDIQGAIDPIDMSELDRLWPKEWVENVRNWFVQNLRRGSVKGDIVIKKTRDSPLSLKGHLSLQKASLRYKQEFPEVEDVWADAIFDKTHFDIALKKGHTRDIQFEKGRVLFQNIDRDDCSVRIVLNIKTSLQDALWLLNHPPLFYADQYGMSFSSLSGYAVGQVILTFPLKKEISGIKVTATAALSDVNWGIIPEIHLTGGDLALALASDGLSLKGAAYVNRILADLSFQDIFGKGITLSAHGNVPLHILNIPFLGDVGLDLRYQGTRENGTLEVNGDLALANIDIPLLGFSKKIKAPGSIKALVSIKNKVLQKFLALHVQAQDLDIYGEGAFKDGKLASFSFPTLHIGQNRLACSQSDNGPIIVRGSSLDLGPWIRQSLKKATKEIPALNLRAYISKIFLDQGVVVNNVDATFQRSKEEWKNVKVIGTFDKDHAVNMIFDLQHLFFKTNDVSALLRGLNISPGFFGGALVIQGRGRHPMKGVFSLQNLMAKNVPLLAQILSLTSFGGILNMLRGKGIVFDNGGGTFEWDHPLLKIEKAYINNSSIGFTGTGSLNFKDDKIALSGAVVPAFMINHLLGSIPLIGTLLSGGNSARGVMSFSYALKGFFDKPQLSVNPFSILTPGILK